MNWGSPYIKGFCGAVVGLALGLIIWHVYVDHVITHQIVKFITEAQANAQQRQQPAAKPPTP